MNENSEKSLWRVAIPRPEPSRPGNDMRPVAWAGSRRRAGRHGFVGIAPTHSRAGTAQDRFHATAGKLAKIHGSWKMRPKAARRPSRESVTSTTGREGDGILTRAASGCWQKLPQAVFGKAYFRPIPGNKDLITSCWRGHAGGTANSAVLIDQPCVYWAIFSGLLRQSTPLYAQSFPIQQQHPSFAGRWNRSPALLMCYACRQDFQAARGQGLAPRFGRGRPMATPHQSSGGNRLAPTRGARRHEPVSF